MKKISFIAVCAFLLVSLTGCFNPAFYNIMNDVPPEEATVSGVVRSITRYTVAGEEYLVTSASGGLLYKKANDTTHGNWKATELPFELLHFDYAAKTPEGASGVHIGQQILKVLADSSNLYMVTVTYRNNTVEGRTDPDEVKIWTSQISDWDNITWNEIALPDRDSGVADDDDKRIFQFYELNDYLSSRFNVFSTNSVKKEHRAVYIRSGSAKSTIYYQLSNGTISKIATPSPADGTTDKPLNGVAYLNGYKFFASSAVCSNENASDDASLIYYGKPYDQMLYVYDGSDSTEAVKCGDEISCIAVTKDSLVIGRANYSTMTATRGGVVRVKLESDGTPDTKLSSFTTNAATQLASSYLIFLLLTVDPTEKEEDAIMYASIGFRGSGTSTSVTYDNVGLWSYMPKPVRGNWNRE